ncbi:MAG TPA: glycosyltransferase [Deltaproteobacteria bacterium]|nr:glycosyltransferase [Deltaproteobacteria bacterium]
MRQGDPTVSVVIPCYNMGEFVDEAVASIWTQTFDDYEVIIVDDGSDDSGTSLKLDCLAQRGVKVIRVTNQGVSAARNRGITTAKGKYILTLDADDLIAPNYLEKAVGVLDSCPDVGVVSCDAELFGNLSGVLKLPEFSVDTLLARNIMHASAVFRKECWRNAGGYGKVMKYGWEDWDFWIAMTTRNCIKVEHLSEPLFKYRIRRGSRDRSMSTFQKFLMMSLIVVRHFRCYVQTPMSLLRLVTNSDAIGNIWGR